MKKLFTVFFAVLIALSFAACKEDEPVITEGVGYGLVHGHYVGEVAVTLEDGEVTDLSVEEYFLPYNWAKVNASAEATGYGLVHGHYVGVVDVTLNQAEQVAEINVDEYFLPYNWAKVAVNERTATSYGLVHGHYVGVIDVTVDATNTVTDVAVEEYFLPYNWAKVEVADPQNLPADVVSVTTSRGTSYYAMYIDVDGVLYTATVAGDSPAQSISYSANGGVDTLTSLVMVEENAKAYVEAIEAGNFFIANQDGSESAYVRSDATSNISMLKSESGYWSGDNYPLGWAGNMAAFETAVTGTKLDAAEETLVKDELTGYWSIGDVVTGATMTDFVDYYQLAQAAYTNTLATYPDDVVTVTTSRGSSVYAKYIDVDGVLYTATVTGEAPAQSITYSANGTDTLTELVMIEANAKAYVEAIEAGNFFVADASGLASTTLTRNDATSNTSMKKSESGYWSGVNYPLGWAGNMAAFETAVTSTKLDADLATIVKNAETGFWSIGDTVTGATMTDFIDYYEVAQRAYATALTQYGDDVVRVATSRGFSYYAKYIKIDGVLFTASVTGEGTAQAVVYSADGIANIETWVEVEANAQAYVQAVKDNDFSIVNADGTASAYTRVDATSNASMKKSESGYWSGTSYPLGWAGNMAAFKAAVTGTKLDADLTTIVKDAETLFWSIGDTVTGATMTDFIDYYEVAQRAYENAE